MIFKIHKRHLPFSIAYCFTILVLLLHQINELPAEGLLLKAKYVYVFFVALLVIINAKIKRGTKAAMLVITLYIVHAVLFGYVLVNGIVAFYVRSHASQMLWFLAFVLVTFLYVSQNDFFKGFVTLSFWVCGLLLLFAMIIHRGDIVNPFWGLIHAFTATYRNRNEFGFIHAGYTSNAAFLVLSLSLFVFELNRKTGNVRKLSFWIPFLIIDAVAGIELISAAERSGIISTFIVFFVYGFFVLLRLRIERKTLLFGVFLCVAVVVLLMANGTFADVWGKSNRDLNISVNYPLFKIYGDPMTGLGFVENSLFRGSFDIFPMASSELDMYYVYIFFTTGYLGSVIIGVALITILIKLLVNKKTDLNILAIGFCTSMLFFALWQCNLFTYRYITSYVISVIFLCTMCNDCCLGEEKCINTESMA